MSLAADIEAKGLAEIDRVMQDYVANTRYNMGRALTKAGRELAFALYEEFRAQPPRPTEGSITASAKARRFRLAPTEEYAKARASAARTFGGKASGYFNIESVGKGRIAATPVVLGKRGRIILAGRKGLSRGSLLRSSDQLVDPASIPSGAKRLNLAALTAVRAMEFRERAGMGGYLSAQFLAYKKVRVGSGPQRQTVLMQNNVLGGSVTISGDDKGFITATVEGPLPGTAKIADRMGIRAKALQRAADSFRADMNTYLRSHGKAEVN